MKIKILNILTTERDSGIENEYSDRFKIKTVKNISFDSFLKEFRVFKPQVVILDCDACTFKEISLCSKIRRSFSGPIIVIIPAKAADFETALRECGADDIVYNASQGRELPTRIKALIRQYRLVTAEELNRNGYRHLKIGELLIKKNRRSVSFNGEEIPLTTSEFDLLWFLAINKNRTVSREVMYRELLNLEFDGLGRCIDNRVVRLKKKLEPVAQNSLLIKSVRSVGYLLVEK